MQITQDDLYNTIQVFQNYGKQVKRYAKANLAQRGKKGELYKSIDYNVNVDGKKVNVSIVINPPADEYWAYVESGVEGREKKLPNVGKNSDMFDLPNFKFKRHNIAEGVIESWIKKKSIRGRVNKKWKGAGNRGGQFIKDKTFAFLIGRSIAKRGLPWTGFLSQPILTQNQNLTNDLLDAFGTDIIKKLDFEFKVK
tara:strand:+ start:3184 stop:3771 length:588 start_codon:yes stop_codon:yes gene_type:complete